MRWAGHLYRTTKERVSKRIFQQKTNGKKKIGTQRKSWLDTIDEDLRTRNSAVVLDKQFQIR